MTTLYSHNVQLTNSQSSLLHLAIISGHTETAQLLLAHHRDFVNQRDAFGCTPLHYAAAFDNVPIAHDLLTYGARLDIRDKQE